MKLIKTALLASILLPGVVGCLEDKSSDDGTTGAASSTATSDTGAGTTGTNTTGTMGGMGGSGTATTTGGAMDTTGTTSAGGAGSTSDSTSAGGTGAGGTAGGPNELDPDTLIPGLDGLFWAFRTTNPDDPGDFKYWLTGAGEECPTGDWATAGATLSKEFQAMGTAGQQYTINFELRGALSLRCYSGGTPTGMTADAAGINEAFYTGGEQFGDSPVNTLELMVSSSTSTLGTYFLNGIPSDSGMCDPTITYDVQYQAQFVIEGDSMITLSSHASDCQALQNCGADPATAGCDPRIVNVDGVQVKASPAQPISDYLGGIEFFPQWLVFDIQSITTP